MADKYKNLKVKELQELLQKNNLPHTGKKEELIDRLVKNDERKALELNSLDDDFGLDEFDDPKINLDDLAHDPELKSLQTTTSSELDKKTDKEEPKKENGTSASSSDKQKTETKPASTARTESNGTKASESNSSKPSTSTTSDEPKPEIVRKPGSNFTYTKITFDKPTSKPAAAKPTTASTSTAAKSASNGNKKSMTELEKKIERAKRFGIDLDENTKKQLRAERFGTAKGGAKRNPMGLDPEVLRKRAERFGLPIRDEALEEEKKRKRAERFGIQTNKRQRK